jgi:integrase
MGNGSPIESIRYKLLSLLNSGRRQQIGIGELAPHDLRRTAAKLCRSKGGELEQIQFLLGHESILTTERYLGSEQDLKNAVKRRPGV